ncbi:MAG: hypothetical protein A3D92_17645 [Bacteroidetes bacterium RIFCSPHIGHO2_02_FULL_44_7]|nr:MAG: hypothetical protein A3D92_17645 [Bacteroidetes bacterium RIFCSPHIGHO2_02_FULL_44_7]
MTGPVKSKKEALLIAQSDALEAYSDLSDFSVRIELNSDIWMIDFEHQDASKIGGLHYLISAVNGEIIKKRYI